MAVASFTQLVDFLRDLRIFRYTLENSYFWRFATLDCSLLIEAFYLLDVLTLNVLTFDVLTLTTMYSNVQCSRPNTQNIFNI